MMVIPNSGGILPRAAFGPSYENLDGVLDEEGFTDWGRRLVTEEEFVELVEYIVALQAHGKAFYSLNEWGKIDAANGLDKTIRQFCVLPT